MTRHKMQLYCLRYWKHYHYVTHWGNEMIDFMIKQIIFDENIFDKTGIKYVLEKHNVFPPNFIQTKYINDNDDDYNHSNSSDGEIAMKNYEMEKFTEKGSITYDKLDFYTKIQICQDFLKDGRNNDNNNDWGKEVKHLINEIMRETKFVCETIIDDKNEQSFNVYNDLRSKYNVGENYKDFEYALYYVNRDERTIRIIYFEKVLQQLLSKIKSLKKLKSPHFNEFLRYHNYLFVQIKVSREKVCDIINEGYNSTDGWDNTKLRTALVNHLINYPNEKHQSQFILLHLFDDLDGWGGNTRNTSDKWYDMCLANMPKCVHSLVPLTLELDKEFNVDSVDSGMKIQVNVNIETRKCPDNQILAIKSPKGTEAKVYIISGDAGTGKTILLSSMFTQSYNRPRRVYWNEDGTGISAEEQFYHHSFNLVLYLNFKRVDFNTIYKCSDFYEYLKSVLPETLKSFSFRQIKKTLSKYKCLILCDGFADDNDNHLKIYQSLVNDQPENWKVVITTQPGNAKLLTGIAERKWKENGVVNLRILGIDRNYMLDLVEEAIFHYIKDGAQDIERKIEDISNDIIENVININTEEEEEKGGRSLMIKDIITKPLYFNHFVNWYIRENYNASGDRMTELDENIINDSYFLKQYVIQEQYKLNYIHKNKCIIELRDLMVFDKLYLWRSLINYMTERKLEWTADEIIKELWLRSSRDIQEYFNIICSYYFDIKHKSKVTSESTTIETLYCYKHAKELEFAAARKICEEIKEELIIRGRKGQKDINERYEEAKKLVDLFKSFLVSYGIAEIPDDNVDDYHFHDMNILFPELMETIIAMHGIYSDIDAADTLSLREAMTILATHQGENSNNDGNKRKRLRSSTIRQSKKYKHNDDDD